jgi:NSS family neurotransmitter:Na+ symporter
LGKVLGYFLVLVVTISGSYYAVVVANVWFSAVFASTIGFSIEHNPLYQQLLANSFIQYGAAALLILIALIVSYAGLRKGIERISIIIMPLFVASIIYIIGYAWSLPEAISKVGQFLSPDFSLIGPDEVFAALGQAFFSIGLGGTFVIVYAGYIKSSSQIPRIAMFTVLGDLGSSLLVSLFLVPCMMVFGINMAAGPSLIFNTLPELFTVMPAGKVIGSIFLISLSLVAFLSLVAAFQVPLSSLNWQGVSKKKLIIGFGILQLVLAYPSAAYPQIIGILDLVFGSGMQILGSMLVVVGMWWGAKRFIFGSQLFSSPNNLMTKFSLVWLRWIIPVTLLIVLIIYVYSSVL